MVSPGSRRPIRSPRGWGGVGHAAAVPGLPGLASPFPSPLPARLWGTAPGAWRKPNCQNSSGLQSHLRVWVTYAFAFSVPVSSTQTQSPRPQQRALGRQSQRPSLTCPTWARWPGVACLACQYLLPPPVPSSGLAGLPPLPPGSKPPSWAGPPWTQPGQLWDQACVVGAAPVPPSQFRPGLGCTGTRPCFSSSDREINSPEGAKVSAACLWAGNKGRAHSFVVPRGKVWLPLPCPALLERFKALLKPTQPEVPCGWFRPGNSPKDQGSSGGWGTRLRSQSR